MMQNILEEIRREVAPLLSRGRTAGYIPQLAEVPLTKFALVVHPLNGDPVGVGDQEEPFSIQSISKLFALVLAMQAGVDSLWRRIGREPSGTAFNSLVQLESEAGIPRNPFINAGAPEGLRSMKNIKENL